MQKMRNVCQLFLLLALAACPAALAGSAYTTNAAVIVARSNPRTYTTTFSVSLAKSNFALSWASVILPVPQDNCYQDVANIRPNGGEILAASNSADRYIRFTLSDADFVGGRATVSYSVDVTLYDITTPLDSISMIYSYDTNLFDYRHNIDANGDLIDPANPRIVAIGSRLWRQSSGALDYAERCYEYVAVNYNYLNPGTGIHPLAELLAQGGGDCGNLSSIYISLLRYKNIPARHIVTVATDGAWHVWAEFFLQNYGWIPVDATLKNGNPSGDFFGRVTGSNGIILNNDLNLTVEPHEGFHAISPILQTYGYWYWGNGDGGMRAYDYAVRSVEK